MHISLLVPIDPCWFILSLPEYLQDNVVSLHWPRCSVSWRTPHQYLIDLVPNKAIRTKVRGLCWVPSLGAPYRTYFHHCLAGVYPIRHRHAFQLYVQMVSNCLYVHNYIYIYIHVHFPVHLVGHWYQREMMCLSVSVGSQITPGQLPRQTVCTDCQAHCTNSEKRNQNSTEFICTLWLWAMYRCRTSGTLWKKKIMSAVNHRTHRQCVCINLGWALPTFRGQRLNMHALTLKRTD